MNFLLQQNDDRQIDNNNKLSYCFAAPRVNNTILLSVYRHKVRRQPLQETFIRRSPEQLQSADQTRAKPLGELDSMDRLKAHAAYRNGNYIYIRILLKNTISRRTAIRTNNVYAHVARVSHHGCSRFFTQNLKSQVMTTSVWLVQKWFDCNLKWNPKDYGGLEVLYVPSDHIWLPDIVLFNK